MHLGAKVKVICSDSGRRFIGVGVTLLTAIALDACEQGRERHRASEDSATIGAQTNSTGDWEHLAPFPYELFEPSAAALDSTIYVIGGILPESTPEGTPVEVLWHLDSEGSWGPGTAAPTLPHHAGLVAVDGKLYLLGGYVGDGGSPSSAVHVYDPVDRRWRLGAPMLTPRAAFGAAVLDGRIHVIGGTAANPSRLDPSQHNPSDRGWSVGTHEVYDPQQDRWERLAPLEVPRDHVSVASIAGVIVVTGGRSDSRLELTTTEIWDSNEMSWRPGAPLPTGRSGAAASGHDGWIYVMGGEGSGIVYASNERYSVDENRWEILPPLPLPRHGLDAVVLRDAIHLIGGGDEFSTSYSATHLRFLVPADPSPPPSSDGRQSR